MHSRSADWVLGLARLISSPSTMLAKMAPGLNSKSPRSWLNTLTPVMSVGRRSGVNWMRRNEQSMDRARALASMVLPTPGTSSMREWPSATNVTSASRISRCFPWTTFSTFSSTSRKRSAKRCQASVFSRASTTTSPAGRAILPGCTQADASRFLPSTEGDGEPFHPSRRLPVQALPELAFSRGRGSQGKQGRRGRSEPELLDAPRGPLFATSGVRSLGHDPPAAFGRITTLPFGRFKHLGPDSGVRSLYSPQVSHGKSARAQRVPPASGSRHRQEGGGARPEGQGRGSRLQRDGLPLRALRDRSPIGAQAAVLRQGPVPGPGTPHPARRLRQGRVVLPVLRCGGRASGPHRPGIAGRRAQLGERGRGVPPVQLQEGEPQAGGRRAATPSPPVRAGGRVQAFARPPRSRVGAVPGLVGRARRRVPLLSVPAPPFLSLLPPRTAPFGPLRRPQPLTWWSASGIKVELCGGEGEDAWPNCSARTAISWTQRAGSACRLGSGLSSPTARS